MSTVIHIAGVQIIRVMYYARNSWFIKSPEYKDTMIAPLNKTISAGSHQIGGVVW